MALKGCGKSPKRECCKTEEHCPQKRGDLLLKYHAVQEENFLSSWLREDVEGKEEDRERLNKRWRETGIGLRLKESVWIVCLARLSWSSVPILRWMVLGIRRGEESVCACCASVCACCACSFPECECGLWGCFL